MATAQSLLDLVDAAIERRLGGDAYEEYSEGADRFRGTSLKDLYQMRQDLMAEVAGGASFSLIEPIDS